MDLATCLCLRELVRSYSMVQDLFWKRSISTVLQVLQYIRLSRRRLWPIRLIMSRTMAMGLRNPENLLAMGKFHKHTTSPVHAQCIKHSPSISVRHFTSSRRHQAVIQQMKPQGMMPTQKARKTQMNAMSVKGMGTDLGRLPGVVILPSWRDHPRSPSKLLKLYWEKFKQTSVAMYA